MIKILGLVLTLSLIFPSLSFAQSANLGPQTGEGTSAIAFGSLPTCDSSNDGFVQAINDSDAATACNGNGSTNALCQCDGAGGWVSVRNVSGSGAAIILDLGDDGGNDSVDLGEIAIEIGDVNNIFTEESADKLSIDPTANWPTSDASETLISAAADPADAGVGRLANAESICWEASPAGTDVCLTVDTSEQVTLSGGVFAAGVGGVGNEVVVDVTGSSNPFHLVNNAIGGDDGCFDVDVTSETASKTIRVVGTPPTITDSMFFTVNNRQVGFCFAGGSDFDNTSGCSDMDSDTNILAQRQCRIIFDTDGVWTVDQTGIDDDSVFILVGSAFDRGHDGGGVFSQETEGIILEGEVHIYKDDALDDATYDYGVQVGMPFSSTTCSTDADCRGATDNSAFVGLQVSEPDRLNWSNFSLKFVNAAEDRNDIGMLSTGNNGIFRNQIGRIDVVNVGHGFVCYGDGCYWDIMGGSGAGTYTSFIRGGDQNRACDTPVSAACNFTATDCVGLDDPYDCCTGAGTGTCTNACTYTFKGCGGLYAANYSCEGTPDVCVHTYENVNFGFDNIDHEGATQVEWLFGSGGVAGNCDTTTGEECLFDEDCPSGESCVSNTLAPCWEDGVDSCMTVSRGQCDTTTTQRCLNTADCPATESCIEAGGFERSWRVSIDTSKNIGDIALGPSLDGDQTFDLSQSKLNIQNATIAETAAGNLVDCHGNVTGKIVLNDIMTVDTPTWDSDCPNAWPYSADCTAEYGHEGDTCFDGDWYVCEGDCDGSNWTKNVVDALDDINAALLSGSDAEIITGTISTTNAVVTVNADDDLVEEGTLTWNVTPSTCTGDGNAGALTVNGSNQIICSADDGGAGSAAFSNAADPVVLNTTTKTVEIGDGAGTAAKLEIGGDADEVQLSVQGHSTQTNDVVVVEDNAGTNLFDIDNSGNGEFAGNVTADAFLSNPSATPNIELEDSDTDDSDADFRIQVTDDVSNNAVVDFQTEEAGTLQTYISLAGDDTEIVVSRAINSTANMLTSGTIRGNVDIIITTTDTDSVSADEMRGSFHIADNATATNDVDYSLPTAAAGLSACFYDNGGGNGGVIVDADTGDQILLDGVGIGTADAVHSPGVAGDGANGDYICLLAIDSTTWITLGRSGTWIDGGP